MEKITLMAERVAMIRDELDFTDLEVATFLDVENIEDFLAIEAGEVGVTAEQLTLLSIFFDVQEKYLTGESSKRKAKKK